MKTDSALFKLKAFVEFLFLKLVPLAIVLIAYLYFVGRTEQDYAFENADYPWVATMLLTVIPLMLIAAIFYRTLKGLWIASKAQVIALGIVLFFIGMAGTRVVMQLNNPIRIGHHPTVIASLQEIYRAQNQFKTTYKKYATLQELVEVELLRPNYLSEDGVRGYKYSGSDISADTFCIHADRVKSGMGNRDFNITESGEVRFIETRVKGTVPRGQGEKAFVYSE